MRATAGVSLALGAGTGEMATPPEIRGRRHMSLARAGFRARYDGFRDRYNRFITRHAILWELTFAALAIVFVTVGFIAEDAGPATQDVVEAVETLLTAVFFLAHRRLEVLAAPA